MYVGAVEVSLGVCVDNAAATTRYPNWNSLTYASRHGLKDERDLYLHH